MKKLIIGLLSGVILFLSTFLVLSSTKQVENETDYYGNIDFDFIIPKPWYSQISEIESMDFINSVIPYYMTSKKASINGSNSKLDFYILENNSDLTKTPYTVKLLITGKMPANNEALIDENVQKKLNVNIGDELKVSFGKESCNFKISGVVKSNKFASNPTVMIYFDGAVKKGIESSINTLSYSGAYVDAKDVSIAENYLNNEYRAKGKIGDKSWYPDNEAYEYTKSSIESLSVSNEIANVPSLKANSLSKYKENTKDNLASLFISIVVDFLLFILIWFIYLFISSKSYSESLKNGKTTTKQVISSFRYGAFITLLLDAVLLFLVRNKIGITSSVVLSIFSLIAFICVFIFTKRIVEKKTPGK